MRIPAARPWNHHWPMLIGWLLTVLGVSPSQAESWELRLESVRYDCSRCPDVWDRYHALVALQTAEATAEAQRAIEAAAVKKIEFAHTQFVELERTVRHSTLLGGATLEFEAVVHRGAGTSCVVDLTYEFQQPQSSTQPRQPGHSGKTTLLCPPGKDVSVMRLESDTQNPKWKLRRELAVTAVDLRLTPVGNGALGGRPATERQPSGHLHTAPDQSAAGTSRMMPRRRSGPLAAEN